MNNISQAKLIGVTNNYERVLGAAARISKTPGDAFKVYELTKKNPFSFLFKNFKNINNINLVKKRRHTSFLEHGTFNFALNNVSAVVENFLIQYRLASFTIKSRRYVDFRDVDFIVPSIFQENNNQELSNAYRDVTRFSIKSYQELVDIGIPAEDARFCLPCGFYNNIIFSANTRELKHILYDMIYGRGKDIKEIHDLGLQMLKQVSRRYGYAFNDLVTSEMFTANKEEKLSPLLNHENKVQNETVTSKVDLLNYTTQSEFNIIMAALVEHGIYDKEYALEILENKELKQSIINIILKNMRKREFEQVNFSFLINNISLSCLPHLIRHRMQSIVVPSISSAIKNNNIIIPPSIEKNEKAKAIYLEVFRRNKELYDKISTLDKANEAASYLSVGGHAVSPMTTLNGREIITILGLRTCERAQWEIRNIALQILKQTREVLPSVFNKVGPNCFMTGKCYEGKESCGLVKKLKKEEKGEIV